MTEYEIDFEEADYLLADFLYEEAGNPEGWCSIREGVAPIRMRRLDREEGVYPECQGVGRKPYSSSPALSKKFNDLRDYTGL